MITLADGRALRCEVMNISLSGACVTAPADLPDTFDLRIRSSAIGLVCRVLWRKGAVVGVLFVARASPSEMGPDALKHT